MPEPPTCPRCGGRHWFLDPCGIAPESKLDGMPTSRPHLDPPPSADEVFKAVRHWRAHKERERNRQRRKRQAADTPT